MFWDLHVTDFILLILAYFVGSIPFGLIITKASGKGDIRHKGSGNIGATNAVRVGGMKIGAVVLILDILKGIVAVVLARTYASADIVATLSAGLAVTGHIFPIWLKFKGGKGVATTFAVLTTLYYPVGLLSVLMWLAIFFYTRISSLSALLTMISMPTIAWFFADEQGYGLICLTFYLSALVVIRHKDNIRRMVSGQEEKIL